MSKKYTAQEVEYLLNLLKTTTVDSLDRKVSVEGELTESEVGDFVEDPGPTPQDIVEASDRLRILRQAVEYLKPREQMIIQMRYGLLDGKFHTLDECGKKYNVTRERIRQVETRALKKLRWVIRCKYKLKMEDM